MSQTLTLAADAAGIEAAGRLLAAGELVAFPTETVYGLGADATNDTAVAGIFAAKGRPHFNPLIAHVADLEAAEALAVFDARARALAEAFWPGPLTLVLPIRPEAGLSPLLSAGHDSVAIRLPAHPLAQKILRAAGRPIAAPSANPSGRVSPTRAEHVLSGLSGRIAAVLDGGPCQVGVESTILGLTGPARLLRPGGLAHEEIEALLGESLQSQSPVTDDIAPNAPGQLSSHYAPRAKVRLEATQQEPGEVLVGFGAVKGDLTLSDRGDLIEAAANLFHMLRQADQLAGPEGRIAFAPVPHHGLGLAINDRLKRAAAPRP